jgi:hypothetical protein
MFNMAFPVYCIIDVYSKKLNIGYGCDLFIVISNLDISYWFDLVVNWIKCVLLKFMKSKFTLNHSFIQLKVVFTSI